MIWQDIAGNGGFKKSYCCLLRSAPRWPTVGRIPEANFFFQYVGQTASLAIRVRVRVRVRVIIRVII